MWNVKYEGRTDNIRYTHGRLIALLFLFLQEINPQIHNLDKYERCIPRFHFNKDNATSFSCKSINNVYVCRRMEISLFSSTSGNIPGVIAFESTWVHVYKNCNHKGLEPPTYY